jgi:hypothetical protein
MKKKVTGIGAAVALAVGGVLKFALPSLRRYLKMEKM